MIEENKNLGAYEMVTLNGYFEELNISAISVVSKEGMIHVLKKIISEREFAS